MPRRVFIDTEWTAVPWSSACDLLWVGLSDEDGRSWCAVSSEARVDPANPRFVADLLQLITPDVPRLSRAEIAAGVQDFCAQVEEFWAWIPPAERFAEWFRLGDDAPAIFQRVWDIDLQMMRALVTPWPTNWPASLCDLRAAAVEAGVELPPRAPNHLHPRVHVEWNRQLFSLIQGAGNAAAR